MKFGLLGARLGHSLSPQIHQEVFRQLGMEATYELIEVPVEKLADKVAELRKTYRGLNVTIPHKVSVMDSLDHIAAEARAIGAVNTVLFDNGGAAGFNTDYFGFARLLMQAHSITVISRVIENAPEDIRAHYTVKTYEDLKVLGGDLLINCTPVGMFPKTDASPVDGTVMDHFAAAVDITAETKFMKLARQQGKTAVNGLFMLVAQAVAAEEIWLGRKLDEGLIADVTDKIAKLL